MRASSIAIALAGLILATPVAASSLDSGSPQASLGWRLDFGGADGLHAGYRLALAYRAAELADAVPLADLDVSDRTALARLAGIPLAARRFQADQNDLDHELMPGEAAPKPWYSRQWVLWTAGGLAATAALLTGGGAGEETGDDVSFSTDGASSVCVLSGGTVADNEIPGACTPPVDGASTGWADRPGRQGDLRESADHAHLDAGTGGMGDLVAR